MLHDCPYGYDTNFVDRTEPIEDAPCFDKPTKDAFFP